MKLLSMTQFICHDIACFFSRNISLNNKKKSFEHQNLAIDVSTRFININSRFADISKIKDYARKK